MIYDPVSKRNLVNFRKGRSDRQTLLKLRKCPYIPDCLSDKCPFSHDCGAPGQQHPIRTFSIASRSSSPPSLPIPPPQHSPSRLSDSIQDGDSMSTVLDWARRHEAFLYRYVRTSKIKYPHIEERLKVRVSISGEEYFGSFELIYLDIISFVSQ